ncbi:sigma-70 family RNA polymerase sigma factor [Sphaerisporangium flaviroseum]|uniref:RNA polymerase sigma factor n=1 Tax=Sphaerisporangium flaviroseum TaxID=509199 RepID=UPI0031ECE367
MNIHLIPFSQIRRAATLYGMFVTQPSKGQSSAAREIREPGMLADSHTPSTSSIDATPKGGTAHWLHSYDAFYEYMYPRIRVAMFAKCRDWGRAEDVAQTSMIICERKWAIVHRHPKPDLYAHKVANRIMLRILQSPDITQEESLTNVEENVLQAHTILTKAGADEAVIRRIVIEGAIRSLPSRQAEVAVLRFINDCSEKEISSILGISIGTVKSTVFTTREKLKSLLEPIMTERGDAE